MTTEHGPERPLSTEEELLVTRALRDLPAPPVPPALSARLDARLAELEDERSRTPVVRAAAGSHRRWPRLLLAAAAVLVAGYAVGVAVDGSRTGNGSSDSRAEGSAGGPADDSRPARDTPRDRAGHAQMLSVPAATLHRGTLRADVRLLVRAAPPPRVVPRVWSPAGVTAPVGCRPPRGGPGSTVWLVRYDGARAFLVTHPEGAQRLHARLFTCHPGGAATSSSPVPSASVTVRVADAR